MLMLKKRTGSQIWKLRNYGLLAVIKHFTVFLSFKPNKKSKTKTATSLIDVCDFFKTDESNLVWLDQMVNKYLMAAEIKFKDSGIEIKKGAVGENASKNRLLCIGLAILKFSPDAFIETGTQNGISAQFAMEISQTLNMKIRIVSFDVQENSQLIPGAKFERIILKTPVRKNLSLDLEELGNNYERIVFFHDSDHSYENMYTEFTKAKKYLNPLAFLSDDIELNNSLSDFSKENNLTYFQFNLDNNNSVGIAIKKSDPDGT